MKFKILTIPKFDKEFKHLVKKYPSLKAEIKALSDTLEVEPQQGVSIGHSCHKIRIAIASKNSGKSGGGRVIINIIFTDEKVYMLTIYDKSEKDDIPDKELMVLLKQIPL